MPAKLTLRLDEKLIQSAKEYSKKSGKSVSRIVADVFTVISYEKLDKIPDNSPAVSSLRGVLKNNTIAEDDYRTHLEDKYL
jgi:hypothetical protein